MPNTMQRQQSMKVEAIKQEEVEAAKKEGKVEEAIVPNFQKTNMDEAPKNSELCPCAACCCVAYSLYAVFPDCLGCYFKGVACCWGCSSAAGAEGGRVHNSPSCTSSGQPASQ